MSTVPTRFGNQAADAIGASGRLTKLIADALRTQEDTAAVNAEWRWQDPEVVAGLIATAITAADAIGATALTSEIRTRLGTDRAVLVVKLPDGAGPEWADGQRVRLTLLPAEEGAAAGQQPAYDAQRLEEFLRRVARPAGRAREQLQIDAAELLVYFGVTCNPAHIGPYFRVPGTDQAERCLTCGAAVGK